MAVKKWAGNILVMVGLMGVALTLLLIATITEQSYLWLIGSAIPFGTGIWLLRKSYLLR